ncbi:MAG: LemA family protein, partial [Clostridia bacterium]
MKKRYDLIPNLVNTVKGYAKHEKETLESVISARNVAMGAKTANEKINAEKGLSGVLSKLMMVAEQYPDLKADRGFLDLQEQLRGLEVEIANARKYYNGNVKVYNNKIMVFPSNIIASMFKFHKVSMFEITSNEERETVKVEF